MAMSWRTGGLFAAGLLVGVAVGGWAVIQAHDRAVWQDNGPTHAMGNGAAPQEPPAAAASQVQSQAQAMPVAAPAAAVAPASVAAQSCDGTAIVAKGSEDGKESLNPDPGAASASEVSALLLTGKEAAASGRMRDAEIVFLNACRAAEAVQGKDGTLSLADAMYQLGRHYANVAQAKGARKGELLARSQRLYQAALQTYQARYGAKGEKTHFAQQGLATVQRLAGGAALPPVAAVTPMKAPAPAPAAPPVAVKHAARQAEPAKPPAAAVAIARPEKPAAPQRHEQHEAADRHESTAATAAAEPAPRLHAAPARHRESLEARAVPAAPAAQPAAHPPKPVHDEPPAVAVLPEHDKPAAREEPSTATAVAPARAPARAPAPAPATADSMPPERPHRAVHEPAPASDAQDAGATRQASAEGPRARARPDDSAADQPPPATASGSPTAEGSPGEPP